MKRTGTHTYTRALKQWTCSFLLSTESLRVQAPKQSPRFLSNWLAGT